MVSRKKKKRPVESQMPETKTPGKAAARKRGSLRDLLGRSRSAVARTPPELRAKVPIYAAHNMNLDAVAADDVYEWFSRKARTCRR